MQLLMSKGLSRCGSRLVGPQHIPGITEQGEGISRSDWPILLQVQLPMDRVEGGGEQPHTLWFPDCLSLLAFSRGSQTSLSPRWAPWRCRTAVRLGSVYAGSPHGMTGAGPWSIIWWRGVRLAGAHG